MTHTCCWPVLASVVNQLAACVIIIVLHVHFKKLANIPSTSLRLLDVIDTFHYSVHDWFWFDKSTISSVHHFLTANPAALLFLLLDRSSININNIIIILINTGE